MNVFDFRNQLVRDYADYIRSFIRIEDERIAEAVEAELTGGLLWPEPLIQLNPSFELGESVEDLVSEGVLHRECSRVFRAGKSSGLGRPIRLYRHQAEAVRTAHAGRNYVLTTGTGSGKSLAYIIPIVDHVLKTGGGKGIRAIIVYPMNALANSQFGELEKFLRDGYPDGNGPATFQKYTGQESDERKEAIVARPPDILLTNYVMLELILTRPRERKMIEAAQGLRFLVLDELHTYRGRQGADVSMLVRRVRDRLGAGDSLRCIGTSATLAGGGSLANQQTEVAEAASRIFGAPVRPDHVIGETLQRITEPADETDPEFASALRARAANPDATPPTTHDAFRTDPLSIWIESTFGVAPEPETGQLVRCIPKAIGGDRGAAAELAGATGLDPDCCAGVIQAGLLAGYFCDPDPITGNRPFAFRLHQFISRGDTVYSTIEPEDRRYITVRGQQFMPGDRNRILFPMAFCRECGQAYYSVRKTKLPESDDLVFLPRGIMDRDAEEGEAIGYLYLSDRNPWPRSPAGLIERVPDDWIEEGPAGSRIRKNRRPQLPRSFAVGTDGGQSESGVVCEFIDSPFRFCLNCGVSYSFRGTDYVRLSSLDAGGRSSATTILALSAIRSLEKADGLDRTARKLLSFTDNRQDASLQAGHFNDFLEVGLLRCGIYQAVRGAGEAGLAYDELVQKVFDALNLPKALYAADPGVRFNAERETDRALRNVLGYRIYRDLKRGWRVNLPNLEGCGLLTIEYASLTELCESEQYWRDCRPALAGAAPADRERIAGVLLDFARRALAIKVEYLDPAFQESIQGQSFNRLVPPWAIDEDERMDHAGVLFPRAKRKSGDYGGDVFLSPRGKFARYLARPGTFPDYDGAIGMEDRAALISDLIRTLQVAGLMEVAREPRGDGDAPGYRIPASAMIWKAGDGRFGAVDLLTTPNVPPEGRTTNPFFVAYYTQAALETVGLRGAEHTAQVSYEHRTARETDFREGQLPVLFCSPTMELGVDIADLNTVNLRNMPPTPANYAQRSGRAGRGGQPALVFSYCTTGSSHDQYFFKRPERMVAGAVSPPRLDLSNEDLIRAHVQAIWLAETGQDLGKSLTSILDLSGNAPSLALLDGVAKSLAGPPAKASALQRAKAVLSGVTDDLRDSDWYSDDWLEAVIRHADATFDRACDRWRSLYRAAHAQARVQGRIIRDASRSPADRKRAERLRGEAEAQLRLLRDEGTRHLQSDFYSYRYFASEGFLPGYNFPRLPLSAYIPGRRARKGFPEFLTRPRFLAVYEFGPQAIVYHEGSRYQIHKAILPPFEGEDPPLFGTKLCEACGYLHPLGETDVVDLCERCGASLGAAISGMFRLQNVSTRRREKISADEEDRLRMGYEIKTGFRFPERDGKPSYRTATARRDGAEVATLFYGNAATLWRINFGWTRRKRGEQGFLLDMERGYWGKGPEGDAPDNEDGLSPLVARVIPFVEDRRNCLIFQPEAILEDHQMASLQSALKNAVQVRFQLEENELAAEPLPSFMDRRMILFYESAEGGAGVLRRLLDDGSALAAVAEEAQGVDLEMGETVRFCHFDPVSGLDLGGPPGAVEKCEAACYDCIMNYGNQKDHGTLDRHSIREYLLELAGSVLEASPGEKPRGEHLADLMKRCDSELEREWLRFVDERGLNLPTHAQYLIRECETRVDFFYDLGAEKVAVFVDGPVHDDAERRERDREVAGCLEDLGVVVVRFGHGEDWDKIIDPFASIFGKC